MRAGVEAEKDGARMELDDVMEVLEEEEVNVRRLRGVLERRMGELRGLGRGRPVTMAMVKPKG